VFVNICQAVLYSSYL